MSDRTLEIGRTLGPASLDALRNTLGTALIAPGDDRYDSARRVWNGMIDRRPAAVARCRGVADVIQCVHVAREEGVPLAVRGGGHNVAGFGTCDGGLVIDLSRLRGVRVDPQARTVRCGGGALWGDVDRETQAFGLGVPGGIVSTTGVAGLTLGGGQGWLRRTYGMTCDSLLSADVVTADGRLLTASDERNEALFWALRGGGGNFGVVTSFRFRARPVGPMVAFAGPVYPLEVASEVIARLVGYLADAPDAVNPSATFWTIPPVPAFPEALHGRDVVIVGAVHAGAPEEGEEAMKPLRSLADPLLDMSGILPYAAVQQLFDPFFPARELQYYWKSIYLDRLDDAVVAELVRQVRSRPSPLSMIAVWALGGAMGRPPADTAVGDRDAPYVVEVLANWSAPDDTGPNVRWTQEAFEAMKPFGSGRTNLNFPGGGDDEEFNRAAFGSSYERLASIKRKYDPTNLFRLNQNIVP